MFVNRIDNNEMSFSEGLKLVFFAENTFPELFKTICPIEGEKSDFVLFLHI